MTALIALIVGGVVTPILGFVLDRYKYARDIKRGAEAALKIDDTIDVLPGSVRSAVEQAVIAANQAEIANAVAKLEAQQREHDQAMAKIAAQQAQDLIDLGHPEVEVVQPTGDEPAKSPWSWK